MYSCVDFFLALYNLVILTIRTWVVYNRDRKMGIFLLTLLAASFVAGFIIEGLLTKNLECKHPVGCGIYFQQSPDEE